MKTHKPKTNRAKNWPQLPEIKRTHTKRAHQKKTKSKKKKRPGLPERTRSCI